jgi:hypothetical protein
MVSNKTRGKYFEDTVAEKIANHLNYSKLDIHRNQDSGNFSTEIGDIHLPFECVIECKFQKAWSYQNFMKKNKLIDNWLQQLNEASNKYEKLFNKSPIIKALVISKPYENIYVFVNENPSQITNVYGVYDDMYIITLDSFLKMLERFKNG